MKEISKQINNAERLAVIEEQLKQNAKEHEVILERVNHNCTLNKQRFDSIEGKLDKLVTRNAERQWRILFWIVTFGVVTLVGLLIAQLT